MIASDGHADAALNDIAVALGQAPADLLLRGCRIVNVASNETYHTDIAIQSGRIVAIRPDYSGSALQSIDCDGLYAVPGLIDLDPDESGIKPGKGLISCTVSNTGPAAEPMLLWQHLMWDGQTGIRTAACQPIGICSDFSDLLHLLRNGTTPFINLADLTNPEALFQAISTHPISPSRLRFAGMGLAGSAQVQRVFCAGLAAGFTAAQIYRMASFGPALSFGLDHMIGSLAPGRRADINLLNDPNDLTAVGTYRPGQSNEIVFEP